MLYAYTKRSITGLEMMQSLRRRSRTNLASTSLLFRAVNAFAYPHDVPNDAAQFLHDVEVIVCGLVRVMEEKYCSN